MVKALRIIAADSSSAILNEKFQPQSVVAAAAVLVNPPFWLTHHIESQRHF
jgi:hypothetical protein